MQPTDGARGRGGGPSASCACRYGSLLQGTGAGIGIRLAAVRVSCLTRCIGIRCALTRQALGTVTKAGFTVLETRLIVLTEAILTLVKAILTLAETILLLIKAVLTEAIILTKAVLLLGLRYNGVGIIGRLARRCLKVVLLRLLGQRKRASGKPQGYAHYTQLFQKFPGHHTSSFCYCVYDLSYLALLVILSGRTSVIPFIHRRLLAFKLFLIEHWLLLGFWQWILIRRHFGTVR